MTNFQKTTKEALTTISMILSPYFPLFFTLSFIIWIKYTSKGIEGKLTWKSFLLIYLHSFYVNDYLMLGYVLMVGILTKTLLCKALGISILLFRREAFGRNALSFLGPKAFLSRHRVVNRFTVKRYLKGRLK